MPVGAVRAIAKAQNGLGAFILQCKRLEFHYCDWAGSSAGMNTFLRKLLPAFAKKNPQIEILISPRPGRHPVIRGHYVNGRERAICVRNLQPHEVSEKVDILRNASGEKVKKFNKPVSSTNEGVRGIWSPHHEYDQRWKI